MSYEMVVIGTSAGGLDAVCSLLGTLPAGFDLPLLIVQHRSKDSTALASVLQDCTSLRVCEVTDKDGIERGNVYLAPPDYHVMVEPGYFALTVDEPVAFSRPSIDVSFESAADAYGAALVGIVLTGANQDGARGLRRIADRGGYALVQDPATAEVAVMPAAAAKAVPEAEMLALDGIVARLHALAASMGALTGRPR